MAGAEDERSIHQIVNNQQNVSTNVANSSNQPLKTEPTTYQPTLLGDDTSRINIFRQAVERLNNLYRSVAAANSFRNPFGLPNYSPAYPVTNIHGVNQPVFLVLQYPINTRFQASDFMHYLPQNHFDNQEQNLGLFRNPQSFQTPNMPEQMRHNLVSSSRPQQSFGLSQSSDSHVYNDQSVAGFRASHPRPYPIHRTREEYLKRLSRDQLESLVIELHDQHHSLSAATTYGFRYHEYVINKILDKQQVLEHSLDLRKYLGPIRPDGKAECIICKKIFSSRDDTLLHIKGIHMRCVYSCPICGEKFNRKLIRDRHLNDPNIHPRHPPMN